MSADPSKLQSLYTTIQGAISGGQLQLVPSWFPGNTAVNNALIALGASAGLTITGVSAEYPTGGDQVITITGVVTLGSTAFAAQIVIGLDGDSNYTITINLPPTGASPLPLTLTGAPWFSISNPRISVSTVSKLSGSASGTITLGGTPCTASAVLQVDGTWLFGLDWTGNGPSIDSVFQFIGGVNLVSVLPSPLNGISTLALNALSFQYDFSQKTLQLFTVAIGSTYPWDLFGTGKLVLTDLTFTFVNDLVNSKVTWSVGSSFKVNGKGPLDVTISYATPTFTLSAYPPEGATAVALTDFINAFLPAQAPQIPSSISPFALTSFDASFTPATGQAATAYAIEVELVSNATWALSNTITVESLGFTIDATSPPTTTGSITGTIAFFKSEPKPLTLDVSAVYDGTEWVLETIENGPTDVASILGGLGIPSPSTLNFAITDVAALLHTGSTSPSPYLVMSGAVSDFTMPFTLPITLQKVSGCFGVSLGSTSGATVTPACLDGDAPLPFGTIGADTTWWGVPITFGYKYTGTPSYTVTWISPSGDALVATLSKPDTDWIGTIAFTSSTTLGAMVESFVSWATGYKFGLASPWDLLDEISLSGLQLEFNFTKKTVGLTLNFGIDLGFCSISGATITYNAGQIDPATTKRVAFSLNGNFPWNAGSKDLEATTDALTWDATKPESTKVPPGQGTGLLDLRLLALGQYVTIPGVASATTVQDAIKAFNDAPAPPSGTTTLPNVYYDSKTNWLIGLDMGLLELKKSDPDAPGYCVTVQIVFDDPQLYGLRLALSGEPAKVFGGLDFQIMYRKISDTVGVYEAAITLPKAMRTIQTGIYTIQLPTFAIAVYTNGDFQIDVGFPWNADFTRSFTVQAIIYPGIPVLGAGGFYFGKLSSATSSSVPTVTNGTFDPVIVFGFGAQVGFGKSVSIGPLNAGFSLTVLAIIQGVIARWNGFTSGDQPAGQSATQIDGVYYYSLTGTFGIQGTLNGSVDFVIIKASVNITITVTAQITFAAYEPIVLSVNASVDASASLEINCGLFSFSISFHFSVDVHESFSLPSPSSGSPPWQIAAKSQNRLGSPAARLTRARRETLLKAGAAPAWNTTPTWTNLQPPVSKVPLRGYLTYALTAAGDENNAANPNQVCYIATLAIDNGLTMTGVPCYGIDTSWGALCRLVTRWVLAAFWNAPVGCDATSGVDSLTITETELLTIYDYLANEDSQGRPLPNPNPMPIDPTALDTMLGQQVAMTLLGPTDQSPGTTINAAFFPMPGAIGLNIPAYPGFPGYQYSFGSFNTIAAADLPLLQSYFSQIAVQVEKEQQGQKLRAKALDVSAVPSLSVAGFVFADYFLLIARQMISNLRAGLRDYKYTNTPSLSVQNVVDAITAGGGQISGPGGPYTPADVFAFNPGLAFAASKPLTIAGAARAVQSGDTFASIAKLPSYSSAFSAAALALANADNATLLQANQSVTFAGATLVVNSADTLTTLAARFSTAGKTVTASDLANDAGIQQQQGLLMSLAKIALPPFPYTTAAGDTVASVAAAYGINAADLGTPLAGGSNPNAGVAGLFDPSATYIDVPHLTQLNVGMLLNEVADTGGFDTLSGMVSRFHLHGLRLPTKTTVNGTTTQLITANATGMWVTGSGPYTLPPAAGLFALTGQQFPIPAITSAPFTITLSGGPSWIAYASAGSGTISITNAAKDPFDPAIEALRTLVTPANYRFLSGYSEPDGSGQLARTPTAFSLGPYQNWIGAALPPLPAPAPPAGAVPRIWPFPSGLASILNSLTHRVNPNLVVQTQTYDESTGKTNIGSVPNYAWASTFEFTVKRLPTSSSEPATSDTPASAQTYQIVGANASTIVLLEDIIGEFPNDTNIWGLWLMSAPDPSLRLSGLQAFGDSTVFGIGQGNLSTVTRPPGVQGMLGAALEAAPQNGPIALNGNSMFVRLLWEASITNSGGFYLYYRDGDNGLPDHLFDKYGNAVLTGVLVYGNASDVSGGAPMAVYDCMNAVVVADPFNPSATALVAEAVPTPVSADASQTLATIASAYYGDLSDIAHTNSGLALTANVPVVVNEGTYMVPPSQMPPLGGNTLTSIATWFGTTASAIQAANPRITTWPAQLPTYTALRLPSITVAAGSKAANGQMLSSLADIAGFFGADIVGLAVDNENVANLFASNPSINVGPWSTTAKLPPGSQLLQLQRDVPVTSNPPTAAQLMLTQYSMLGYQIAGQTIANNYDFTDSNMGVPVGPLSSAGGTGTGKLRRPNALAANTPGGWQYNITLAYTSQIAGATATSSPYLGVGRLLQVDLAWYDYFGNTIASDLSSPKAGDTGTPNLQPTLLGYTDALVAVGQWPSVNASWQVGGTYPSPQLVLNFTFDTTRYLSPTDGPKQAAADAAVYAQLLAQLGDTNGTQFTLQTSLSATPIEITGTNLSTLTGWLTTIAQYLNQVASGGPATAPISPLVGPDGKPLTFALPSTAPAQQIFELTCDIALARTAGVVEGEFAAIDGIRSTTTALKPTMPATAAEQQNGSPGLAGFATAFETAYAGPTTALKVASGPNRFDASVASSSTIWAVQVGQPPAPISFAIAEQTTAIANAPGPLIFAPKPIARELVTNSAPIWLYSTGSAINFQKPADQTQPFSNVDLDQWVRTLFGAVDTLLGPQYIAALEILDNHSGGILKPLQDHKKALAAMYAQQMAIVFTDQTGDNTAVSAAFTQAMYEELGNAYLTQAALQYATTVNAGTIEAIPPNLYGPIVQTTAPMSGVAFAPAKLPLQQSGSAPLTVLVTTPTQAGDTADQFVPVSLAYTATNIEHQIAPPDGSGYQASSWLSFVLPQNNFTLPLGPVKIPMVLRAYPSSPVMGSQSGPSTVAEPQTLLQATQWTYAFTYTLGMHYPQDVISLSVEFNLATAAMAEAVFADSFATLAEFIAVYPAIEPDLSGTLATLTTTSTPAQFATAQAAVQSVVNILDRIAPVTAAPSTRRFAVARPPRHMISATGTTMGCSVQETTAADASPAVTIAIDPKALIITVTVPPNGGIVPLIELSPSYVDPLNPGTARFVTMPVGPATTDPDSKITTQQYYVVDTTAPNSPPVPFSTAQSYGPRAVLYQGLQILDLQDAQAFASVTRNQKLVPGRTTRDEFVYQTAEVTFTGGCRPTIVQTTPISVGALAPPQPPAPPIGNAPRSLADNLTALFYTLVSGASATSASMQLTVSYEFSMAGNAVSLPILMQPALSVSWATGADTLAPMITDLASAITTWFTDVQPIAGGQVVISLAVFTSVTQQLVPLVRLTNLQIALADIANPSLPVTPPGA